MRSLAHHRPSTVIHAYDFPLSPLGRVRHLADNHCDIQRSVKLVARFAIVDDVLYAEQSWWLTALRMVIDSLWERLSLIVSLERLRSHGLEVLLFRQHYSPWN